MERITRLENDIIAGGPAAVAVVAMAQPVVIV